MICSVQLCNPLLSPVNHCGDNGISKEFEAGTSSGLAAAQVNAFAMDRLAGTDSLIVRLTNCQPTCRHSRSVIPTGAELT